MATVVEFPGAVRDLVREARRIVLTRNELMRDPLGGRTWRGTLVNRGRAGLEEVAVEIGFFDADGRSVGTVGGCADRLTPDSGLDLQTRLPPAAVCLQVRSLRWRRDLGRKAAGPGPRIPLGPVRH